jgi:hypothetical protein
MRVPDFRVDAGHRLVDLFFPLGFSIVAMTAAAALVKRTL